MSGIGIAGGTGGAHARTEDLARATEVLATAGERIEAVASWARAARSQISRNVWPDPVIAEHALDALDWVNAGAGGADAVAKEIARTSAALTEAVRLYEKAEVDARGLAGDLAAGVKTAFRRGTAIVEGIALVDTIAVAPWSVLFDGGPSGMTGVPTPELTTVLDPYLLEAAIGAAHDVKPFFPFSDISLADLAGFALMLSAMSMAELFGNPHGLSVEASGQTTSRAAGGAADLIENVESLYPPKDDDDVSHVAIEQILHGDGTTAWIVEIPGLQDILSLGGTNPFDGTACFQAMQIHSADIMVAVTAAMEKAGIPPGDPVMFAGHSLGGIAAMALASNESVTSRYNVQAVVTAGSPVGRFEPLGDVSVLSMENSTDLVWALDGTPNPDTEDWITVTHDLRASGDPLDQAAVTELFGGHEPASYVRTAQDFDASGAASAADWRDRNSEFLADSETVSIRTTYDVTRGTEGATIPTIEDR